MRKKDSVVLLALLMLAGCAQYQRLEPGVYHRRNLEVVVDGNSIHGIGVIPEKSRYDIVVQPQGESAILIVKTCHREMTFDKAKGGWFSSGKYKISYEPVPGLETNRVCDLQIDSYDSVNGQHSWAFLTSLDSTYELEGELTCNGTISRFKGVSICQSKHSLIQRIAFDEPVQFWPPRPTNCPMPKRVGRYYELELPVGECLYHMDTKDGRRARLTTIGYQGVLVEKPQ